MKVYYTSLNYYECDKCDKRWKTEEDDNYVTNLILAGRKILCPYCGYQNEIDGVHQVGVGLEYITFLDLREDSEEQSSMSLLSLKRIPG